MNRIALRSIVSGKFVTAEMGLGGKLFANRPNANKWETFEIIPLRHPLVAVRNRHNEKFVCTDLSQGNLLVADRDGIREWETFELHWLSQATAGAPAQVALRSVANWNWVSVEADLGGQVSANRPHVHPSESFDLVVL